MDRQSSNILQFNHIISITIISKQLVEEKGLFMIGRDEETKYLISLRNEEDDFIVIPVGYL